MLLLKKLLPIIQSILECRNCDGAQIVFVGNWSRSGGQGYCGRVNTTCNRRSDMCMFKCTSKDGVYHFATWQCILSKWNPRIRTRRRKQKTMAKLWPFNWSTISEKHGTDISCERFNLLTALSYVVEKVTDIEWNVAVPVVALHQWWVVTITTPAPFQRSHQKFQVRFKMMTKTLEFHDEVSCSVKRGDGRFWALNKVFGYFGDLLDMNRMNTERIAVAHALILSDFFPYQNPV